MKKYTLDFSSAVISLIDNSVLKGTSVNQALSICMLLNCDYDISDIKDLSEGSRKKRTLIDAETHQKMKRLRSFIRKTYGILLTYSQIAELIIRSALNPKPHRIVSLNVHGYMSRPAVLARRCARIAEIIDTQNPTMIFLQELITGDDLSVLNSMLEKLSCRYVPVFPAGFSPALHYNYCICAALIREDKAIKIQVRNLNTQKNSLKMRYNYFACNGKVFLNVWIPQTFNVSSDRKEDATELWKLCLKTIRLFAVQDVEFYFLGDLNSFTDGGNGMFEQELRETEQLLFNTKTNDCFALKTTGGHTLDQIYANRYAVQKNAQLATDIFEPSFRAEELSDHDALILNILPLFFFSKRSSAPS